MMLLVPLRGVGEELGLGEVKGGLLQLEEVFGEGLGVEVFEVVFGEVEEGRVRPELTNKQHYI